MGHHNRIIATLTLFALIGCATPSPEFESYGSTREALREGETHGRVKLDELHIDERTYAVGALASLEGEVTIEAGRVFISQRSNDGLTTSADLTGKEATMLFVGRVAEWTEHPVTAPVTPEALDGYVGKLLTDAGFGEQEKVAFLVEGPLTDLHMHVIDGECPIRANMLNRPMKRPAYEHTASAVEGRLIGIYGKLAPGAISHAGSDTHIHVVLEIDGKQATGHVEAVGLGQGAIVRIPTRRR